MQVTLTLTDEQAAALHDLVTDADMHRGHVVYPVALPDGMYDAIAEPVLRELMRLRGELIPRQDSMDEMVAAGRPPEAILDAAMLHIDADLFGQLWRDYPHLRERIDTRIPEVLHS